MKYIRTKNGRILEFDKMITPCIYKTKPNKKGVYEEIGNGWVYRLADTIEELIDEKVLIQKNGYPTLLETIEFDRNIYLRINEYEFGTQLPRNPIIYGAIWTNKGLIYVAKMNEKGELELL